METGLILSIIGTAIMGLVPTIWAIKEIILWIYSCIEY